MSENERHQLGFLIIMLPVIGLWIAYGYHIWKRHRGGS
jgi:hypothetical protein